MTLRRGALDAIRFPPATLDALVAAIDVNDRIDLSATLPESVILDIRPERLIDGFALSRQLWREGFDWRRLLLLAKDLRHGGPLDDGERRWFKQARARFKHLRFAFFLYSAGHRSPPLLSLVTLVLGELQDAVRVRGPDDVRRHARRLELLLTAPARALLMRETDRFEPGDVASFRQFTRSQMATIQPLLAAPLTDAHAFHAARKVVSRQVSFHDDMRTLHPSPDHLAFARALATINGLMGRFHDDLVARDASGEFRYRQDLFMLPDDIRSHLQALVALYLGASSS